MKIDFNEDKHEYSVDGVRVPSVSDILAPLNADRYGEINQAVLRSAAERGKAVHEICEAIDYDLFTSEAEDEMPPELAGYVDAYFQFLFDHDVYWEMVEQIVGYYRGVEGEPPLYCGTVDRYGIVDGRKAVVDIKTYASMTTEAQMTASCQTALYRNAIMAKPTITGVAGETIDTDALKHDEEIPARFILHLKKDGKYRLIDLANFDYNRGWSGPTVAGELLHLYYEKQTALAGKRGKK